MGRGQERCLTWRMPDKAMGKQKGRVGSVALVAEGRLLSIGSSGVTACGAAMGKRTHQHIDERCVDGEVKFVVNRKVGGHSASLGSFDSLAQAVKCLHNKYPDEGITEENLRVKRRKAEPVITVPQRNWAKVYYEPKRVGAAKWLQHERYGGRNYFLTEKECAEAVAAYLQCPMSDLALKNKQMVRHPLGLQHKIFEELMDIMAEKLPGDAADMKARAADPSVHQVFVESPGIIASFIVSKLTDNRDVLLKATRECLRSSAAKKMSVTEVLHSVLLRGAELMSEQRWPEAWTESVGKGVIRFQTYWEHLCKLGVLTRVQPSGTAKTFTFCDTGTVYYSLPLSDHSRKKLLTQIKWGQACLAASPILTCQDYKRNVDALDAACPDLAGATDPKKYMKKWFNRGYLIYDMWRKKKGMLRVDGCTVRSFLPSFPDAKDRLLPLLSEKLGASNNANKARSMTVALDALRYTGPPELLSMWACLCGDPDIVNILARRGLGWLQQHKVEFKKRRHAYEKAHGIPPHPAILLKQFLRQ